MLGVNRLRLQKSTLWSTYIATGRSTVEYAGAAWLPWVSLSRMEKLEEQSPDKSRGLRLRRFYQEPTFQPLLPWPHNSVPWPWRSPFECLIQTREGKYLHQKAASALKRQVEERHPASPGDVILGPRTQKGLLGSYHPGYKPETVFSRWMEQGQVMR